MHNNTSQKFWIVLSSICSLLYVGCPKNDPFILPHLTDEQQAFIEREEHGAPPEAPEGSMGFSPIPIDKGECTGAEDYEGILIDEGRAVRCSWYKIEYDKLMVENDALWKLVLFYRTQTDDLILWIQDDLVPQCERSWFEDNAFTIGLASGTLLTAIVTVVVVVAVDQ